MVDVAAIKGDIAVPVPKEPSDGKTPAGIVVDVMVLWGEYVVPVPKEPLGGKLPLGTLEGAVGSWVVVLEGAAGSWVMVLEAAALYDEEPASCWGWGFGAAAAMLRNARMRGRYSSLMTSIIAGRNPRTGISRLYWR